MNVVSLLLLFCSVLTLVSMTIGRTMMRIAAETGELPIGRRLPLLEQPIARLDNVHITEIVKWNHDLLVGFNGASGSWIETGNDPQQTAVRDNLCNYAGQAIFPGSAHDRRAKRLLTDWQHDTRTITAVITDDATIALIDTHTRQALLGARLTTRQP